MDELELDALKRMDLHKALGLITDEVFEDYQSAERFVCDLFNEHVLVLREGGKIKFGWWPISPHHPTNGEDPPRLELSGTDEMAHMFENRQIRYWHEPPEGDRKVKTIPALSLFRKAALRRTKFGVQFASNGRADDSKINLYYGLGLQPGEGDWPTLEQFLVNVICGQEPDPVSAADDLIRLIAWKLQNMDQPTEKALILRGRKGTGKGTLYKLIQRLIGKGYCLETTDAEQVFGRFNSHLQHLAVLSLNEAFWHGSHKDEAKLKGLITENELVLERKFGAVMKARNSIMLMLSANADWVVPATWEERRFAVYDLDPCRRQDFEYFKKMDAAINGPEAQAMLYDLLNMELSGWHPRLMQDTAGLSEQKQHSLKSHELWLRLMVEDPSAANRVEKGRWGFDTQGSLMFSPATGIKTLKDMPDVTEWGEEDVFLGTAEAVHECYREFARRNRDRYDKHLSEIGLVKALSALFGGKGNALFYSKRAKTPGGWTGRYWVIGPRSVVREYLETHIPGLFDTDAEDTGDLAVSAKDRVETF